MPENYSKLLIYSSNFLLSSSFIALLSNSQWCVGHSPTKFLESFISVIVALSSKSATALTCAISICLLYPHIAHS